jgi:hypothetical protein
VVQIVEKFSGFCNRGFIFFSLKLKFIFKYVKQIDLVTCLERVDLNNLSWELRSVVSNVKNIQGTVNIRNPDCTVLSDSILCQSRTFEYLTI